jgi:o-succinylbenzoate synthase
MHKKLKSRFYPYTLEFNFLAKTSRDEMKTRAIWIIEIEDNFGKKGIGEIAPLKGLSLELDPSFEEKISQVCEKIEYYLLHLDELNEYPSILFGIETAWMHYKNQNMIFFDTPFTRGETFLPTNALIWMGDAKSMWDEAFKKIEDEATCMKFKIGGLDFKEELDLLKKIRQFRSNKTLQVRLDANGALLEEDAIQELSILSEFDIHSIEQPIKKGQLDSMTQLIANSPIPIALDEELIGHHSFEEKNQLLDRLMPHYIVLKPSLHGGIKGCSEWIYLAEIKKIGWWITSALESNIGLNAIAQWASNYPSVYEFHQGLGTGSLYSNNFDSLLSIQNFKLYFDRKF